MLKEPPNPNDGILKRIVTLVLLTSGNRSSYDSFN